MELIHFVGFVNKILFWQIHTPVFKYTTYKKDNHFCILLMYNCLPLNNSRINGLAYVQGK